jgi:DAACS family dicarboxylate/amino acid:cation (Na+ or H+) symporter
MLDVVTRLLASALRSPLYLRVLVGVIVGAAIGMALGKQEFAFGWTTAHFGVIAGLYVQVLTAMAIPLIFLAIVDAFVRTNITGRQGLKMILVCGVNIAVAFAIGLALLNVWQPGLTWREKFSLAGAAADSKDTQPAQPPGAGTAASAGPNAAANPAKAPGDASLSPLAIISSFIPKSIAQPFVENMVLTVALLAILVGAAVRSLKTTTDPQLAAALVTLEHVIVASFQIVLKLLLWLIELAPLAICLAVAKVFGETGWATFQIVGVFFLFVCTGLALHALVYYPLSSWLATGRSPLAIFRDGGSAIVTGFSLNSSLATSPLTLEALRKMGVSDSSARLSACVGTNFNNDGITLYEAMTALFIAQAVGMEMSLGQQITILLAALVGSMGIAGIPNSGLIILALVLSAARLPEAAIQTAIPLVYSIDFIVARIRSAVNVMGDLQVAMLLDGRQAASKLPAAEPEPLPEASGPGEAKLG